MSGFVLVRAERIWRRINIHSWVQYCNVQPKDQELPVGCAWITVAIIELWTIEIGGLTANCQEAAQPWKQDAGRCDWRSLLHIVGKTIVISLLILPNAEPDP